MNHLVGRCGRGTRRAAFLALVLCAAAVGFVPRGLAEDRGGRAVGGLGEDLGSDAELARLYRQSVALGVPEKEFGRLLERCRASGFTGAETRRMVRLVAGAKLAGLPHMDLLNKLGEGLAKGASPEAIGEALERKAQSLRRGKGIVDTLLMEGWNTADYPMAIQMVADALEAGATPAEVLCAVREGKPCREGVPDVRMAFHDGVPRR